MADDNPFARLGLQKDVVESLHKQGRLEEFLRTYYRSIQAYVHPDRGGDSALAASINAAYSSIQQKPSNIEMWIRGMSEGNGLNSEYLGIIEGLTARVEELQRVEADYRNLQKQYAEILVSGDGTKADVRRASPRARREDRFEEEDDAFEEDFDKARVGFDDTPSIKKPKARRVDADAEASTVGRVKTKERAVPRAEPIKLTNLISYGMDGKPIKYNAYLDSEAVRKADGKYLIESQVGFEKYFASGKDGRRLPSLREWYAMTVLLGDTKRTEFDGLIRDMKDSWLCTGTKIDYKNNLVIHPGYDPIECTFPAGDHWLDEVIDDKKWRRVLRALFGPRDVELVPEVLEKISGKRPYLWTPDVSGRKSLPERAVWLYINAGGFYLSCSSNPIDSLGRARGVRVVSA